MTPPIYGFNGNGRIGSLMSVRLLEAGCQVWAYDPSPATVEMALAKVKRCLHDSIGCAFESHHLPWAVQARGLAEPVNAGCTMIGSTTAVSAGAAAFGNAGMGHGRVQEDMHRGSFSHLGIVVLPALLALAESRRATGLDFVSAVVTGYEAGGAVG